MCQPETLRTDEHALQDHPMAVSSEEAEKHTTPLTSVIWVPPFEPAGVWTCCLCFKWNFSKFVQILLKIIFIINPINQM